MPKFYGYKRCSTSRKAQKWFDDKGISYDFQDLVETPPEKDLLLSWLTKYQDRGLRYFFNTSGQHYRQMGLKDKLPNMTIEEAADLLSEDGKLIKRPLVVDDQHLTCGFKEEVYAQTWKYAKTSSGFWNLFFCFYSPKAWARSAIKSSAFSRPTESRKSRGVIPSLRRWSSATSSWVW